MRTTLGSLRHTSVGCHCAGSPRSQDRTCACLLCLHSAVWSSCLLPLAYTCGRCCVLRVSPLDAHPSVSNPSGCHRTLLRSKCCPWHLRIHTRLCAIVAERHD